MQVTKDYLQERGVLAFQRGHGFLFAEFSMGVGKTKLAIDIIRHLKRSREGWIKVLYICHTTASRDITTPNEFREWDAYHLLESGEVTLVQYEKLDEISHMSYDLVIFDECHLITARRYEFFNRNVAVRILLLTGTRPDNGDKMDMLPDYAGATCSTIIWSRLPSMVPSMISHLSWYLWTWTHKRA